VSRFKLLDLLGRRSQQSHQPDTDRCNRHCLAKTNWDMVLSYMRIVNLLKLLTIACFIYSCAATTTGAKPYAVTVERDVPPKFSYCELSFTFTNKGRYLDDLTIRYVAFDRQGNTLTESFVMFDTTGPNQKNIQKERIHADSLKSKIHPCSALSRLVITTNGHLLEEREFTFIPVDYPAMR